MYDMQPWVLKGAYGMRYLLNDVAQIITRFTQPLTRKNEILPNISLNVIEIYFNIGDIHIFLVAQLIYNNNRKILMTSFIRGRCNENYAE